MILVSHGIIQEATNGLNRVIGDGLRKYPKRLTESFILAEQGVINGSFVFMHVKNPFYNAKKIRTSFYLHLVSRSDKF